MAFSITGQWKEWVFSSDLHGDECHGPTVERFHRFCDELNPPIRIFGGDAFNFAALRKGASADDRAKPIRHDMETGLRFLDRMFSAKCEQKHLLWGNHDICRLLHLAETSKQDGLLQQLALDGLHDIESRVKKLGIKALPYHKRLGILEIGHAKFAHGYYCGVNAARQHAITYGSLHYGHTHAIDLAPVPGLERRVARSGGCLCLLDMDYNSRNPGTLRQAHGWMYGAINLKTGTFFTRQAEEIDGVWSIDILK